MYFQSYSFDQQSSLAGANVELSVNWRTLKHVTLTWRRLKFFIFNLKKTMHISFLLSIFLFSLQVQANVLNITETAGHVKTFFGSDVPNHIKENLDKLKNKIKAHIYKTYPEIYGEGPTNVTTVVDTIFDGSLNKYKQSCQRLFDRLDANKVR